jgi:hypothetical protein
MEEAEALRADDNEVNGNQDIQKPWKEENKNSGNEGHNRLQFKSKLDHGSLREQRRLRTGLILKQISLGLTLEL